MNTENTKVMNKETIELFNGKYCDVSISNLIMEEHDIRFCTVGYTEERIKTYDEFVTVVDETESLLIIEKNGVHFELNGNEIDSVDVDDKKGITITLIFTDGTVIVIRPLGNFEARQCYAHELLMLELTRDSYKRELFED